jgi:hypothetical protein
MRFLSALAALALACSSSSSPPPPATAPPPAASKDAAPPAAKPPTEAERRARVDAALARIPEIKRELAELRGLPFKADIPAEYQDSKDFRAYVKGEIARELPASRAEPLAEAYVHLGLLKEKLDLAKTLEDALVSQAGAYFDPKLKKFFLVMAPTSDSALDTISAHELTHALQDQHYGLEKYYPHDESGEPLIDDDAMNARRFVVEGDATFAMMAYTTKEMAGVDPLAPAQLPAMQMQIAMMAGMSIEQLKEMNKAQSVDADMGEDIEAALEAMDSIPLILIVPLMESYTKGALPVFTAFKRGGWPEVAKLYRDPPASTEQVLHPTEKLYPNRDVPKRVALATPPGHRMVRSEVIGELGWRVYFMMWNKAASDTAAAGWDGDRFLVARGKDGKLVGLVATTWDSEVDAEQFEKAYRESLVARFGGDGGKRPDGSPIQVVRRKTEVFVVDGSADPTLMAALGKLRFK